jgi:phospholipid/cholesterol/gamma-HCH transport system substrate-binding protein
MGSRSTELKVGVLVVVSMIILAFMTVTVGKIQVGGRRGYEVLVNLDNASGLVRNSPVTVSGVDAGRVERIRLEKGKPTLLLRIKPQVGLPRDSLVYVRTEGLLGEKYIEIEPGSPEAGIVQPGEHLKQGAPTADLDAVFSQLNAVAEDIRKFTRAFGDALAGEEGAEKIRKIVDSLASFSDNLATLAEKLESGQGTLGKLLTDDKVYNDVEQITASLRDFAQKLNGGEGLLAQLVSDEDLAEDFKATLAGLRDLSKKLSEGEGTMGKLFADETLYEDLKVAVSSLRNIARKIDTGRGTLGKLVSDKTRYEDSEHTSEEGAQAKEKGEDVVPITVLGTALGTAVK